MKPKTIKTLQQKSIITQSNRFIYAKYNMTTNEMKFFMWIIAQINSQKDQLFQICEIPLSSIMGIWERKDETPDYAYIRDLCRSMLSKTYMEDFKLFDPETKKETKVFKGYPIFKEIEYRDGSGFISYQLNDSLMTHLLNLNRDFTQIKFDDIQRMKSNYSIRIYNMLLCELKQNRQSLKINLSVLQNILGVPKSLLIWDCFNKRVLNQALKDINAKSNIVLFGIQTLKNGRRVTDLEFSFDYKSNTERIERDKKKKESYNQVLLDLLLKNYADKRFYFKEYGMLCYSHWEYENEEQKQIVVCLKRPFDPDNPNKTEKTFHFYLSSFKDLDILENAKNAQIENFYLENCNKQIFKEFQEEKK